MFCQNAATLRRGKLFGRQAKFKPSGFIGGSHVYTGNESQCTPSRLLLSVLISLLSLVLLSTVAYGQGTASVVGTVTDSTGAAVPAAKITITNTDNGFVRNTVSNATGSY